MSILKLVFLRDLRGFDGRVLPILLYCAHKIITFSSHGFKNYAETYPRTRGKV